MPKFTFEIRRRVSVVRTVTVTAKTEDEAEEKVDRMIADSDKKIGLDRLQFVIGDGWTEDEDEIDSQMI